MDLYRRAYRSLGHKDTADRSNEARRAGLGTNINAFADAITDLYQARMKADYDPFFRIARSDATAKVSTARDAVAKFNLATAAERTAYLAFILFKKRQ
jgi:hypothetical protein